MKFIVLLRGINVGGKNLMAMPKLKAAFEKAGFQNVVTYINSGNVLFDSDMDEASIKVTCEKAIANEFGLDIPVCVISATDLVRAMAEAPDWWNVEPDTRHDVFFVIPSMTAEEICSHAGSVKEAYEKVAYSGRIIFWFFSMATFSRTRWSKIVKDKAMYRAITVRNANTALKLVMMAQQQ
jgi:uncharacterized protein (DUF1697 family)